MHTTCTQHYTTQFLPKAKHHSICSAHKIPYFLLHNQHEIYRTFGAKVCVCVCDLHTNYGVQVGSTALLNCHAKKGALWQYAFSFNFFYPVCSWRCKLYAEAAHTQENTVILQDQKVNDQQNLITSSVIYERTSRVHKLHRKSKFHMNECKITCHLLHLRPKKNCHSCRPQTY